MSGDPMSLSGVRWLGALLFRELERHAHHGEREHRHPARAVGLNKFSANRQRLRAVKHADVVEAEEAAAPPPATFDGTISRPSQLLDAIFAAGRKGLSISRYKGLGEMNAEQLWETTLDPAARTLLRVDVDEAADADDIFAKLMGDVVEERRNFIQENALNVANLDV